MFIVLSYLLYDYVSIQQNNINVNIDDIIIFKNADNYNEHGKVIYTFKSNKRMDIKVREGIYIRHANPHDLQLISASEKACSKFLGLAKKLARNQNLNMRFAKVNMTFDGSKLFFLFSADERIDFRNLVKDLTEATLKPIHLHQIGPRDHARILGGVGICGYNQCCNMHLAHKELPSINVDMIRAQKLDSRGTQKLSGNCGKLLCCIDYELDVYLELTKQLPKIGDAISYISENGEKNIATVKDINILGQMIYIKKDEGIYTWIKASSIIKS